MVVRIIELFWIGVLADLIASVGLLLLFAIALLLDGAAGPNRNRIALQNNKGSKRKPFSMDVATALWLSSGRVEASG